MRKSAHLINTSSVLSQPRQPGTLPNLPPKCTLMHPNPVDRLSGPDIYVQATEITLNSVMSTGMATPVTAASLRPITIESGEAEHTFLIPNKLFSSAQQLKQGFADSLAADAELEITDSGELFAKFLEYVTNIVDEEPGPFDEILPSVLNEFENRFLIGNDVHTMAAQMNTEDPDGVVRAYFSARYAANRPIRPHASALLRAAEDGNAGLAAIFGGQGTSEAYFLELVKLYDTYPHVLKPFLTFASRLLSNLASNHPDASKVYAEGLDVINWLDNPETRPSEDYLVFAPVSVPVIGLIQLSHYLVTCCVLGITPGEFGSYIKSATGHSQGVITAVAVATCDTWDDFNEAAARCLSLLFYIGFRCNSVYPETSLLPSVVEDSVENNEGTPSPMMSIRDLTQHHVEQFIQRANKYLPEDKHIGISLINGPKSFVVSGPPMSLYGLNKLLREEKAGADADQGRVPFSKRVTRITNRFLPITSPFHGDLLKDATDLIIKDCKDLSFDATELKFKVLDTYDGADLRESPNLARRLVELITVLPVHWEPATDFGDAVTHVLDFGPGGASGLASLTHRLKEGSGVRLIVAGVLDGHPPSDELGYKQEIFNRSSGSVVYAPNWVKEFSPSLVKTKSGKIYVDTKFSRLLGRPPLMVPGMVPATVKPKVVAATLNAGYHIELGGGGYFLESALEGALREIQKSTNPTVGISLNVLYVNPYLLQMSIPLVQRLRKEGFPIEGLTIGAGVPSLEVANGYIRDLGLKHISFKPGTTESLRAAIKIAAANPDFPVIIQWTGGRGGGHHSFEDFHQPILSTYSSIRKHSNIILVAGSGFGDAEGTYPYLTGEWSTKFNCPPMPFDGFLFGSRVMVAREWATSPAAKEAIVKAPGVPDSQWEGTYNKPTGGVLTVLSEMGEPIHKIATRGVLLWKHLDDTVFTLPRNKRVEALLKQKDTLIERLNKEFQKPWFGRKADGKLVDIEDMTYAEIIDRLVELMYVPKENRWIDVSLRNMTGKFIQRVEERLTQTSDRLSSLQSFSQLEKPAEFLEKFYDAYPDARTQIVNAQDKDFFLALCMDRAKKPVPFVPALDENFEFYFKKDSLWQSEDLAAVCGQDVQRTCILQSPVSTQYSKVVDEPIKDILDGIHDGHIGRLVDTLYNGDYDKIPVIESFGGVPPDGHTDIEYHNNNVGITTMGKTTKFSIDSNGELPSETAWLDALAGGKYGWRYALISSLRIVQGDHHIPNPIRRILAPVHGLTVKIHDFDDHEKMSIEVYAPKKVITMQYKKGIIEVKLIEHRTVTGKPVELSLMYEYNPDIGYAPITEIVADRNNRIKEFYWKAWFGDDNVPEKLPETWKEPAVKVSRNDIKNFVHAVSNRGEAYADISGKPLYAPMDFAIVLGWKAIIKAIFPRDVDGDLLKLVHLNNGYKMLPDATPLKEGDEVSTVARTNSIRISPAGKVVEVLGTLIRDGKPVMEVVSQFLYRGSFNDFHTTFTHQDETPTEVVLSTPKDVAILCSKEWLHLADGIDQEYLLGKTLTFRCHTTLRYKTATVYSSVETTGKVVHVLPTKEVVEIADVEYHAGESFGNPVVDYLQRIGRPIEQPVLFENPFSLTKDVLSSRAPASNVLYAQVSGDYNPIHVSPVFSNYVGLPGTITHGMYSSASVRAQVEIWAAENHIERFRAFKCDFVGMVLPNDTLETKMEHVGMVTGRKIVKFKTVKTDTQEPVLIGEAEVAQPTTAYMFTGQGSQEQGMGMALYDSSPVAREVWDRADRHFVSTYGISILDIVRHNPPELTVYFGGEQGKLIRENYISMMFETVDETTGKLVQERIFKDMDESTDHYTFRSPTGVLSMTQFTQPALTLMEKAAFEDMKSKGLVDSDCVFAGHSLGEYSALASMAEVMPVESLVDVVFYRGMTMQVAVPRDELGRSNYGMVAVNPSRVSRTFDDRALRLVVNEVGKETKWLTEIVNYNVANQQYVVAGDLRGLDTLTNVLNVLKLQKIDIVKLQEQMTEDEVKAHLKEIISEVSQKSIEKPQPIELERGFAVIPLPGISVPFHSSYLRSGVNPFKNFLSKRVSKNAVKPANLVGKYIPNLTARPFEISKDYFQDVYDLTGSAEIKAVLDRWDEITA